MTIDQPGFREDVAESVYHSDPCPVPSLSSSCAKTLVARSPMHAYAEHPRLGGKPFAATDEMDFGSLAHKLLLGKGAEIALCPEETWRGKTAAAFWDASQAAGKIPVLQKTLDRANTMTDSVRTQLEAIGLGHVFDLDTDAKSELAGFWKEGESWCRLLLDRAIFDASRLRCQVFDLKTMSQSSHPRACAARIASMGYDIQRAHYLRGIEAIRPDLAGRIDWTFIFVETSAPFAVTPVEMSGEWARIGEAKWQRALELWQRCNETGVWPGYVTDTTRLEAPAWALMDEYEAGE